ncbi:ribonuclease H-like domain-containing protein [Tanacetum coccineum]
MLMRLLVRLLNQTVYMHQPHGFQDYVHPDYTGDRYAYLLLYVDDIVLTAFSESLLQQIIKSLHQEFAMTDLGPLNYFLGISVTRDSSGLFLSQKKYAIEILDMAHMDNCNSNRTSIDTESKLGSDGNPVSDPTLYWSLVGSLQYLTFTRPDISYAVQQVCLYMHDPRESYFSALKRIMRYVRGTLEYGLQLFSSSTTDLVAYLDADWAGCPTTRRSTSEVKYHGVANAVAETCWLRNLLYELHTPLSSATLVYCDNVSAVYLSCNQVQHQRTKHIEIDIHFVRDLVAASQIRVLHVPSRYQFADIFTKWLPSTLFEEFRSSLSGKTNGQQAAASHLKGALTRHGFSISDHTRLPIVGSQDVRSQLLKAIEESEIYVVVLSLSYPYSTRCLDELVFIMDSLPKFKKRKIFPIFFNVEPSDVRSQEGSFKEAFQDHENHVNPERVQRWRQALKDAGQSCVFGISGSGKTTIAKSVYDRIAADFDVSCFIQDIHNYEYGGQNWKVKLQKDVISCLTGNDKFMGIHNDGAGKIKRLISGQKVLLVLDDVYRFEQLQALGIHSAYFGYEPVDQKFVDEISLRAGGLPLVLEVWSRHFTYHERKQWPRILETLKQIPHEDIQKKFQMSFDSLTKRAKKLFLDIVCFFVGMDKNLVVKVLQDEYPGFFPDIEIKYLVDKGLIKTDDFSTGLLLHDMIKKMGQEVVRQENKEEPGQRTRLMVRNDVDGNLPCAVKAMFELLNNLLPLSRLCGLMSGLEPIMSPRLTSKDGVLSKG